MQIIDGLNVIFEIKTSKQKIICTDKKNKKSLKHIMATKVSTMLETTLPCCGSWLPTSIHFVRLQAPHLQIKPQ